MQAKTNLRARIIDAVRSDILGGRLAPESRVNESQLSVDLGVSRTPLREALLGLEREGLIRSEPARGFFVTPLSAREVREIYPIGRELGVLALRSLGHVPSATVTSLAALNERFRAARGRPLRAKQIDDEFHATLIGECPNRRLLEMLGSIQRSMARYERLYMGDDDDVERSARQHDEVLNALRNDDLERAAGVLREHWDYGAGRLIRRLGDVV